MTRQEANKEILDILGKYIKKYPHLRFGQLLCNTRIIEQDSQITSHNVEIFTKDPFYEESEETLERLKNIKF